MNKDSNLFFFDSGKKSDDPVNIYKHQLHVFIKKENALNLIANIAKSAEENNDDDFIDLGFAGEMTDG